MGMTLTEKILARASGRDTVQPDDIIVIEPDVVLSHDNTAPISGIFEQLPHQHVKYPERLAITLDHAVPPPTPKHAQNHAKIREFVKAQGIEQFFEVGRGICHQVLCEEGVVGPGMTLLGADSHSPHYGWLGAFSAGIGRSEIAALWATGELWLRVPETMRVTLTGELQRGVMSKDFTIHLIGQLTSDGATYMAVEFDGDGTRNMSAESRMVLTNMMAEMGAKSAVIAPDDVTWSWLDAELQRTRPQDYKARIATFRERALYADDDATYAIHHTIDLSKIEPMVSCPHTVDNTQPVSNLDHVAVDVGFIGTCTNGQLEDIAIAAETLKGHKIKSRLIVIPASSMVLRDATEAGYITTLLDAGATIGTPGCGPCMGNHMGILAPNEVCISSASRNFRGRMGERDSDIYLSSPAVVAASCITGHIVHPSEIGD